MQTRIYGSLIRTFSGFWGPKSGVSSHDGLPFIGKSPCWPQTPIASACSLSSTRRSGRCTRRPRPPSRPPTRSTSPRTSARWDSLSADECHFITQILPFFAASDGIVMENHTVRFTKEVQLSEACAFYGFQIVINNIHFEMYSLLLETDVKDSAEKDPFFRAVPIVGHKVDWPSANRL
ncbi:C2 domain-containing protein [Psidium guajava]|nr:C2 domain-containing protein [Psidium guajava]